MAKGDKSNRKFWIIGVIALFIIVGAIYYFSTTESMWTVFDDYEDRIINCSADLSTSMTTLDWNSASYQVTTCKNLVNEGLLKINKWYRDMPEDREVITAKLDYEATAYICDFYKILIDVTRNQYSKLEIAQRATNAIALVDKTVQNIDTIENSYSNTQYYGRYYKPREREIQASRNTLLNARNQLQNELEQAQNCSAGFVFGQDYECHPQCGSNTTYCVEGSCCNGQCMTCSSDSYLGTDCKCYLRQ